MLKRILGMSCVLTFVAAGAGRGQAPSGPPQPGPEHKKLAYFVGKWTSESEMKPSPLGPGGKVTGTDHCEWFAGGFHVTCRSEAKGPGGDYKGLGIIGYSSEEKIYTYYGIDNMGMGEASRGSVQGDTWSWSGESKMGGKVMKSRYTMKEVSPDSYTFKWEMSSDGAPWAVVMEGKSARAK